MYEAELERAHGQMLEEMQSMEEDKNRAIEEAFARAQVEMKAVHENLAGESTAGAPPAPCPSSMCGLPHTLCVPLGVRTNLLTLQPALRTLTSDYNGLKRQVRSFPLLLQEALQSVKAEVSKGNQGSRSRTGETWNLGSPVSTQGSLPKLRAPRQATHLCTLLQALFENRPVDRSGRFVGICLTVAV